MTESDMSDNEFDFHDENEAVVVEKARSVSITTRSHGSSMASLVHLDKSADDIVTSYHDLDLEFETFSGSLEDNVQKPKEPEPAPEDEFHFVSPKLSNNNLISAVKSTSSTTSMLANETTTNDSTMMKSSSTNAATADTTVEETQPALNVLKTREVNLPLKEYKRKTSNFKAIKVSTDKSLPPLEHDTKIKDLTTQCAQYDLKIKKIKQEIEYLEYLYTNTPSVEEISKLGKAIEVLLLKLESVKKEKYNSTVKLNHLVLKSPTISGGEYWSRTVS